jgi:hypothetical protein
MSCYFTWLILLSCFLLFQHNYQTHVYITGYKVYMSKVLYIVAPYMWDTKDYLYTTIYLHLSVKFSSDLI